MTGAQQALPYLIAGVSHRLDQRLAAALAPLALTVRQFGVLDALRRGPHSSAAELARAGLVSRQTMNGLLRQLEALGAVEHTDRTRGRAVGLALTAHGQALHTAAQRIADDTERDALGWLSAEERRVLTGLLTRARHRLGQWEDGP